MTQKYLTVLAFISLIAFVQFSSALIVNSVDAPTLAPGQEGTISIELENILSDTVSEVSLQLKFENLPFIPVGTSEQSVDEIDEDDDENFVFRIKASSEITPGDYEIPYTLSYTFDNDDVTRTGSIGISVKANPDLTFSISTEMPVENTQGKITLKLVNKGFYDARFVSVRILPEGFTLLSDNEVYIGTVDSDDFETATFDVIFRKNSRFKAIVEYKDFDNKLVLTNIDLPLTVHTREKALELGIIEKSNTTFYILIAITVILIFIIWRMIKKRRRLRRSMREKEEK